MKSLFRRIPPRLRRTTCILAGVVGFLAAPLASRGESTGAGAVAGKPIYAMSEAELGACLASLHRGTPDLRERIVALARRCIGQPIELYLLGEYPFENYDAQPVYSLKKTDCLVFVEQAYAMGLARDWPTFIKLLQRIRYREGRIGVATRNHFTEADWMPANRWLAEEIDFRGMPVRRADYVMKIDRARFLREKFNYESGIPAVVHRDWFVPADQVGLIESQLRDGDLIGFVRTPPGAPGGRDGDPVTVAWVGHLGLVAHDPAGQVTIIHAAMPAVQEEPLRRFLERAIDDARSSPLPVPVIVGMKLLRLREDALAQLRKIDGDEAPRVWLPNGSPWLPLKRENAATPSNL